MIRTIASRCSPISINLKHLNIALHSFCQNGHFGDSPRKYRWSRKLLWFLNFPCGLAYSLICWALLIFDHIQLFNATFGSSFLIPSLVFRRRRYNEGISPSPSCRRTSCTFVVGKLPVPATTEYRDLCRQATNEKQWGVWLVYRETRKDAALSVRHTRPGAVQVQAWGRRRSWRKKAISIPLLSFRGCCREEEEKAW